MTREELVQIINGAASVVEESNAKGYAEKGHVIGALVLAALLGQPSKEIADALKVSAKPFESSFGPYPDAIREQIRNAP